MKTQNKLALILLVMLAACGEYGKDKNIPIKDRPISVDESDESQKYVRSKTLNLNLEQNNSILYIKETELVFDTVSTKAQIMVETEVINLGQDPLRIQGILVSSPNIDPSPTEFELSPGQSQLIKFNIDPTYLSGDFSSTILILNNSKDIEKKVRISGYINTK